MWLEYVKVVLLAAAQGVAEFLPISSSGHLLVLGDWFGFDAESNLTLNVVLHAGTLLAILVFYFRRLWSILVDPARRRLIELVVVGTIPAAVVGLTLKKMNWEQLLFCSPWVAAGGFLVTAVVLGWVFGLKRRDESEPATAVSSERMSFKNAWLIGCAQAVAITPGISRSGSTISIGVKLGVRKADAAEFSFLLAIPAIGGAALLEGVDMLKSGALARMSGAEIVMLGVGFIISAGVGYASLAGLMAMLRKGRLGIFAYYLYGAAAVVAVVQILSIFR